MFRKDLIPLLQDRPLSVREIARLVGEPPGDVAEDLEHLLRSLRHLDYEAVVTPARCRKCGFEFSTEKLRKPSRCAACHATWLEEPRILIRARTAQ